jgi:hypothetical protein
MIGLGLRVVAIATVALATLTACASAWTSLEIAGVRREEIRQISSGRVTFREPRGGVFAECTTMLSGNLIGGRLNNALPRVIGQITRVESAGCGLTAAGLPWNVEMDIVLPAAGREPGEAVAPGSITGALLSFPGAAGRNEAGFIQEALCGYQGAIRTLFVINRGTWEPLEVRPRTEFAPSGLCRVGTLTLVGSFSPPELAQTLNFRSRSRGGQAADRAWPLDRSGCREERSSAAPGRLRQMRVFTLRAERGAPNPLAGV